MFIRIVRMHFKAEDVDKFLELFYRNEHAIRSFRGCRELDLLQDADDLSTFVTISEWETTEDLEAYRKSDLFASIWPQAKELFASKALAFTVQRGKP